MTEINRVVFILAKHDPRAVQDPAHKLLDIQEHDELISMLSNYGADKYRNVLLSMVRYLKSFQDANDVKRDELEREIKSAFHRHGYNAVSDKDQLYLVERVFINDDEVYLEPINVWNIDVRIMKAILLRRVFHNNFNRRDVDIIYWMFDLYQYYSNVTIGGVDESYKAEFVHELNKYLYEFYIRSNDPKISIISYYKRKYESNMLATYNKKIKIKPIRFDLTFKYSIDQTIYNIEDYCNNLIFYAERLFEINYLEESFKAECGRGNSNYKKKFELYDRCIFVYDTFKDIVGPNRSINDRYFNTKIDGKKNDILKNCKDLSKKDHLKLRIEIRNCYNKALQLIEQSTQGYLS